MWRKSENSNSIKPSEYEEGLSTIYVRRNFEFHEETEDKSVHWTYEEAEYDKSLAPLLQKINEQENLIKSLAQKQGYKLVQTSENVLEFIKDGASELPSGDYINPITYVKGMSVETGKFYTNGDDIWEAMKGGIPTGFDDKEYFDIIEV